MLSSSVLSPKPPPGEDPTLISKQQIFARIVGALGGRAAEEVIFGEAEVTSGASGDLQQVSQGYCYCCCRREQHANRTVLVCVRGWRPVANTLRDSYFHPGTARRRLLSADVTPS